MDVRDAVEADADVLATLAGTPTAVMRDLIHDRTVRVGLEDADIRGFVSYDADDRTVHVTQLHGETAACRRLLNEPVGFARTEGMDVELLVPGEDDTQRDVVEDAGFHDVGSGPRFDGAETVRYRWQNDGVAEDTSTRSE